MFECHIIRYALYIYRVKEGPSFPRVPLPILSPELNRARAQYDIRIALSTAGSAPEEKMDDRERERERLLFHEIWG